MSRYKIRLSDDSRYNLLTNLCIPNWMHEYLDGESVIYDSKLKETIYVPHVVRCQLCKRDFENCTKPTVLACQNARINREFNYVAKICIDCYYWIENTRGNHQNIPKTVRKRLDNGHSIGGLEYLVL